MKNQVLNFVTAVSVVATALGASTSLAASKKASTESAMDAVSCSRDLIYATAGFVTVSYEANRGLGGFPFDRGGSVTKYTKIPAVRKDLVQAFLVLTKHISEGSLTQTDADQVLWTCQSKTRATAKLKISEKTSSNDPTIILPTDPKLYDRNQELIAAAGLKPGARKFVTEVLLKNESCQRVSVSAAASFFVGLEAGVAAGFCHGRGGQRFFVITPEGGLAGAAGVTASIGLDRGAVTSGWFRTAQIQSAGRVQGAAGIGASVSTDSVDRQVFAESTKRSYGVAAGVGLTVSGVGKLNLRLLRLPDDRASMAVRLTQ